MRKQKNITRVNIMVKNRNFVEILVKNTKIFNNFK